MSRLIVGATAPPAATPDPAPAPAAPAPVAPVLTPVTDGVNLTVTHILPAGQAVQVPVIVPPYAGGNAIFRLATGWTDATVQSIQFIRDRGPNLTPQAEEWGGTGRFVLVQADRPWWQLPSGTTQIDLEYDSAHPLGVSITYQPAASL